MKEATRRGRSSTLVVRHRGPSFLQRLVIFVVGLVAITGTGAAVVYWRNPEWVMAFVTGGATTKARPMPAPPAPPATPPAPTTAEPQASALAAPTIQPIATASGIPAAAPPPKPPVASAAPSAKPKPKPAVPKPVSGPAATPSPPGLVY